MYVCMYVCMYIRPAGVEPIVPNRWGCSHLQPTYPQLVKDKGSQKADWLLDRVWEFNILQHHSEITWDSLGMVIPTTTNNRNP